MFGAGKFYGINALEITNPTASNHQRLRQIYARLLFSNQTKLVH